MQEQTAAALVSGGIFWAARNLLRARRAQQAVDSGHAVPAAAGADTDGSVPSGMNGRLTPEELLSWPQRVWGAGSATESSDDEDFVVLPFDTFAACRWLDASPDDAEEFGDMFSALRAVAAYYFRADKQGICDTLEKYGVAEMLYDIACVGSNLLSTVHHEGHKQDAESCIIDKEDAKHHLTPTQREEMAALVGNLMRQLECLLHEYLSFNWHHAEAVLRCNQGVLHDNMLVDIAPAPERHDSLSSMGAVELPHPPQHVAQHGNGLDRSGSDASSTDAISPQEGDGSLRKRSGRLFEDGQRRMNSVSSSGSLHSQPSGEAGAQQLERGGSGAKLAHLRSREAARKDRTHRRALHNWHRAQAAVSRKLTTEMLGTQRKLRTTFEIFAELKKGCEAQHQSGDGSERRQPVVLFLGGGMAAGKSTVREIIGKDVFWSSVAKDAVVVEADAIKNRDVVYQQLSHALPSSSNIAAEVHEFSTSAAESMFATAINRGQDVIFDGTMMWPPFVKQCIAMVRDHEHNYVRGPGYHKDDDGNVTERYFEVDDESPVDSGTRLPYRVEMVGVTCDPGLAVARGIWRQVRTQRGVPIHSQLRSHKLFSTHFDELARLVDSATLYHTGSDLTSFTKAGPRPDPKVIAHRSPATRGEMLVNPGSWARFCHKARINVKASCRKELYEVAGPHEDRVCRSDAQQLEPLRHAFRRAETFRQRGGASTADDERGDVLRIPE